MLQTDKGAWQPADMNPGMRPLAFCAIRPEGACQCHASSADRSRDRKRERKNITMRFIHIADVHLGAQPDAGPLYSRQRPRELWETFEHVIHVCEEEQTDLLLIAGDLFHRQPLVRELKEVDYLFSELTHTKVVLIAGNHDYIRTDSNYLTFQWSKNVYPLLSDKPQYVDFPELRTAVYGMSYHSREIGRPLYDSLQAADREPFEILLAHGGDDRHIPIDRQKLERSGFDYVALGHIHKPQVMRKDQIVYSGALEPIDKNDTGRHGYVRGEITEKGARTQWVPCACREYIHFESAVGVEDTTGSVKKQIEKKINEYGNENIYKIVLVGKRNRDVFLDPERMKGEKNILEIIDRTSPAYDFERLYEENEDTILGRYIGRFRGCREGSVEYQALCEGVEALLGSRQ